MKVPKCSLPRLVLVASLAIAIAMTGISGVSGVGDERGPPEVTLLGGRDWWDFFCWRAMEFDNSSGL